MTYLPQAQKKKYELARVSIKAIAVHVGELQTVLTGKQKQEVVIIGNDSSYTVEENVGHIETYTPWEFHSSG